MDLPIIQPSQPRPTIKLGSTQLPALKDWKLNEKYQIVLDVEMVARREGQEYPFEVGVKPGEQEGTFAILAASLPEEVKAKEEAEKEKKKSFGTLFGDHMKKLVGMGDMGGMKSSEYNEY